MIETAIPTTLNGGPADGDVVDIPPNVSVVSLSCLGSGWAEYIKSPQGDWYFAAFAPQPLGYELS